MKDLFPGFYPPIGGDIDLSVQPAIVVFDANVLLNLYRYPIDASQDLLRLMEALADRVWLPHHSALEYHRNRLNVIAEQNKRFRDVQLVVEKGVSGLEKELDNLQLTKRHSTIDATNFLTDIKGAAQKFLADLKNQHENHPDVTDEDQIRDRLNKVFAAHVGEPPADQPWISTVEEQGKVRYASKIPPGYRDQAKEGEIFSHRGLLYRREFGDLILWKQLIKHCQDKKPRQVVFVTDDAKEDWWLTIDSSGPNRMGPRPELTDELAREAGVERFFMFSSERFAQRFAPLLNIELRATTVEQVRDVKSTLSESVAVKCPTCGVIGDEIVGVFSGSSALHFCAGCGGRFHVHRGGDGSVFTRERGARAATLKTHRVQAVCPKCREVVPANVRDDQETVERYCMNCCSLLKIDSSGNVLSSKASNPVPTRTVTTDGRFTYLACPACADDKPVRTIWGDDTLIRAVCPTCSKLLEARIDEAP